MLRKNIPITDHGGYHGDRIWKYYPRLIHVVLGPCDATPSKGRMLQARVACHWRKSTLVQPALS